MLRTKLESRPRPSDLIGTVCKLENRRLMLHPNARTHICDHSSATDAATTKVRSLRDASLTFILVIISFGRISRHFSGDILRALSTQGSTFHEPVGHVLHLGFIVAA